MRKLAISFKRDCQVKVSNAELKSIPIINILSCWHIWYLVTMKQGLNTKLLVNPPVPYADPDGGRYPSSFLSMEAKVIFDNTFQTVLSKFFSLRFFTGPGGLFDLGAERNIDFLIFSIYLDVAQMFCLLQHVCLLYKYLK